MTANSNPSMTELDAKCIDTIRFLAMEAVQKAKSGHPGMPMGMAAAAYTLWAKHMKFNPANPNWIGRDRFVLSAGHGSMLLYSLLHLFGYGVSIDDLKNFRQMDSMTPGHPEFGHTPGIEVTTGPLGQGLSNAVGMAIAQKYLAARYNKDGYNLFDSTIYTVAGDGCLQEGISSEAASLAGHLGLDNLVLIYDDNHITIDGDTSLSFTENRAKRFEAYNWYVQVVDGDGNDMEAFEKALANAKAENGRPCMIQLRTHIGYGSPSFQDTRTAHGAPLGDDEIRLIKKNFGWDPDKNFFVPDEVAGIAGATKKLGAKLEEEWGELFSEYEKKYPELAKEIKNASDGELGVDLDALMPVFEGGQKMATRSASGAVLNAVMPSLPLVFGGSADLTPSNNTHFKGAVDFQKDSNEGRYIRYGVREHAMGAIMNAINAGGFTRAYGGTFFVFSDYLRPAVRVAALSKYPTIFVMTHDSIGVGEDGPTHQPVEHLASFRAMPNCMVIRPADANETAAAWKVALEIKDAPVLLCLTRQGLEVLDQNKYPSASNLEKGAYVLVPQDKPDVLLMATGSEVELVVAAAEKLAVDGIKAQVVSMPCFELFEKQSDEYKESVLPSSVTARVGVEAAVDNGWWKYLGSGGKFVGMSSFGTSAPGGECFKKFGITVENVVANAKSCLA